MSSVSKVIETNCATAVEPEVNICLKQRHIIRGVSFISASNGLHESIVTTCQTPQSFFLAINKLFKKNLVA